MKKQLFKSELKAIVKECLREILTEGLGGGLELMQTKSNGINNKPGKKHLDNISYNNIATRKKKIKKRVMQSNITNDPILNEILADTATSTLQAQYAAENKKGAAAVATNGDAAAQIMNKSDPMSIFENADKWASLAFS